MYVLNNYIPSTAKILCDVRYYMHLYFINSLCCHGYNIIHSSKLWNPQVQSK